MLTLKSLDALNKPYKIYTDYVEGGAIDQFINVMSQPDVVQGALMPDVHAGYVLPIGGVVATKGTIYPSFVGYDIGCGVSSVLLDLNVEFVIEHAGIINQMIYENIPVGFNGHNSKNTPSKESVEKQIGKCPPEIEDLFESHLFQVGTLGGGNHFIEIGHDDNGFVRLSIHSGSRGFGARVAERFMNMSGGEGCNPLSVDSEEGKSYIRCMNFCLKWALYNRECMMRSLCEPLVVPYNTETVINRNHNHAELKDGLWIHRKGATHAEDGMYGVIPANLRDGVFIVRGKGNPDSLCSSSHGAGRVMSRSKAKKTISLEDFKNSMGDIDLSGFTIDEKRIDESPMAYKDINMVMENQKDLIEVVGHFKPIINVKG